MIPVLIVVRVGLGLAHDGSTTRNSVVLSTFHATTPEGKEVSFSSGGSTTVALGRIGADNESHPHLENTAV